jgi:hypothetical protein
MHTTPPFWRLNRATPARKVVIKNGAARAEPVAMLYEYTGYIKSESTPGLTYHTVVRITVDKTGRPTLTGYTCECKGFTYSKMCKHITALYTAVERDARNRVAKDLKDILEADRLREEIESTTYSLEL